MVGESLAERRVVETCLPALVPIEGKYRQTAADLNVYELTGR